ncbi:MAG: hypothetical protein ACJ8G2_09260 [Burkholderiales bacterium]
MRILIALMLAGAMLSACDRNKPPTPKSEAVSDTHPVKNVETLPSGNIQEGARTMNRASDLGKTLEQQKQDRDNTSESQNK